MCFAHHEGRTKLFTHTHTHVNYLSFNQPTMEREDDGLSPLTHSLNSVPEKSECTNRKVNCRELRWKLSVANFNSGLCFALKSYYTIKKFKASMQKVCEMKKKWKGEEKL